MEENIKTTVSKNKNGYGYKYTDLAQIHEYLESINARYIQQIKRIENDDYVMTKRCFKDVWEDEWLQGAKIVDAVLSGIKNPAQEQGSALTYARRYSLLMAFGLATEDDDAQSLTQPQQKKTTTPKKQTTTQQTTTRRTFATPIQIERIKELVKDIPAMLKHYGIEKIEDLSLTQANEIIKKKTKEEGK